jgi:hypothetical protein
MTNTLLTTFMLFLGTAVSGFATPVRFQLLPAAGSLSGSPGSTVGWGFSLTNMTGDFLVVADSSFCDGGQNPVTATCSPHLGVYSDIVAGNATVLAPGSKLTKAFDLSSSSGLGSYSIWSSAAPGQTDTGSLFLVYDVFDSDPFSGSATQIGGDQIVSAPARVTVKATVTAVPEPALLLQSGLIVVGMLALGRRLTSRVTVRG